MKQLKQFVPLAINDTFYKWLGIAAKATPLQMKKKIGHLYSTDPVGSSWATIGMVHPIEEEQYVHDLDGTARLLMFQINERNLPAAVRNEQLNKRVKRHQELSGLPISKADYARLRDEVEDDLLPQAFIRRTLVPVLVYTDKMLICSVSQKKIDDVLRELFKLAAVNASIVFTPDYFRYQTSCPVVFKQLATGDNLDQSLNSAEECFTPGNALQLKGHDKRTITIKDREAAGYEVQTLIQEEEYTVVELRMQWAPNPGDDPQADFTMNERGHYKKVIIADALVKEHSTEDLHANAWLAAKTYKMLLADVVDVMGGFMKPKESGDALDL